MVLTYKMIMEDVDGSFLCLQHIRCKYISY